MGKGYTRRTLEERFFEKVNRNGPVPAHKPELGPCHEWTAGRSKKGYARFKFEGASMAACRVAFFIEHGRWPTPETIHACDNRACVKARADDLGPAHVDEGTHDANMKDCAGKGRIVTPHGAASPNAKLTEGDVVAIWQAPDSISTLAARHGVSQRVVLLIRTGRAWTTVTSRLGPRTERDHRPPLTDADLAAICEATGTQDEIAARFGISQTHVSRVRRQSRRPGAATTQR